MAWLNYHHLLYFWTVAREGSVTRAAAVLHLSQPAVSSQVRALERALGERLLERRGRGIALTESGALVLRYADDIFAAGREMQQVLSRHDVAGGRRVIVGVSDAVPKLLAYRMMAPALAGPTPPRLIVREDGVERLLADLAIHRVDLILSDAPVPSGVPVAAHSHHLGTSALAMYGVPTLARSLRRKFPQSLEGAPLLLPGASSTLRRSLDQWFDRLGVRPKVVAECDDSALIKTFAQAGAGLFVAPLTIEREIRRQYGVSRVGNMTGLSENFYAITPQRRITNPAVAAVTAAARHELTR